MIEETLLAQICAANKAKADASIDEFSHKVVEDARSAFEWGAAVVVDAARAHVFGTADEALARKDSKATVESIRLYARREATNGARWPERSTSVISNLMHQEVTAAWAELLMLIEGR